MNSLPKRLVALSFIGLIILGNIWLMTMFTGQEAPAWTAYGFFFCVAGCFVSLAFYLPEWLKARQESE